MDRARARALLNGERARPERLLQGDEVDDADRRNADQTGTRWPS